MSTIAVTAHDVLRQRLSAKPSTLFHKNAARLPTQTDIIGSNSVRKHQRQRHVRCEYTTGAMAAEWNDDRAMVRAVNFSDVFAEGKAARQASRALRSGWARIVENTQR